jgi:Ulp1 family protease
LKDKRPKIKSKQYLKEHGLLPWKSKHFGSFRDDQKVDGEKEILVYPKHDSSHGAIILTMNDVRRLKPGVYLNDNLLDFYLQYLWKEKWDESLRKRVHLFNTFFFKKWSGCTQKVNEGDLQYDLSRYNVVRKWAKNVDIFTKDFLVIPVNHKLHWSLAIVCFPGAVLETTQDCKRRCCILGFDSLRLFRDAHFDQIKRYMNMAWSNRAVKSVRHLPFASKRCIPIETPIQNNGADCGLFVLHNCETFFDQGGFPDYNRPSPGLHWYSKSDISHKREKIFQLISMKSGIDLSVESLKMFRASGKDRKKLAE